MVATGLIVLGCILFITGFAMMAWDLASTEIKSAPRWYTLTAILCPIFGGFIALIGLTLHLNTLS